MAFQVLIVLVDTSAWDGRIILITATWTVAFIWQTRIGLVRTQAML